MQKTVDLPEYLGMVNRIVRSAGRRVADADASDLAALVAIRASVDAAILEAVRGLRASGTTWQEIGAVTGTTRQAALMKWNPLLAAAADPAPDAGGPPRSLQSPSRGTRLGQVATR